MATASTTSNSNSQAVSISAQDQFLYATQHYNADAIIRTPIAENSIIRFSLPKSGLLLKLRLIITGAITISGTVTSGTWQGAPDSRAPYSWIQRYKLSNNGAVILHSLTGANLMTWLRYRNGMDYDQIDGSSSNCSDSLLALGMPSTTTGQIVPGANISTGTYSINRVIDIPVAFNQAGSLGLINLQNQNNEFQVELTLGSLVSGITATGGTTSLINSLVGTGLSVTLSTALNISVKCENFAIIKGTSANLSKFMFVQDQTKQCVNGDNYFDMPNSELYTLVIMKLINNGLYVPNAQVTSKIEMQYGGNRTRYTREPREVIGANYNSISYQVPPENGCYAFDMMHRKANPLMNDVYDAFNDKNTTDFRLHYTLALTTPVNPYLSVISESLRTAV